MCWGCHIFFKDAFRFLWLAVIWMSQLPVGVTWFRTVITVLFKQSLLFRMIKPVGGMQGPIELYIYVRSLFYGEDRATPNTQVHLQLCRSSSMQLGRTLPSPFYLVSAGLYPICSVAGVPCQIGKRLETACPCEASATAGLWQDTRWCVLASTPPTLPAAMLVCSTIQRQHAYCSICKVICWCAALWRVADLRQIVPWLMMAIGADWRDRSITSDFVEASLILRNRTFKSMCCSFLCCPKFEMWC